MKRRKLLAMGSVSVIGGLGGCIDETQPSDPEQNDENEDTTETDDNKPDATGEDGTFKRYSREATCSDPPDDITEIEYEHWTTNAHTGPPPLLENGYHDKHWRDAAEEDRFSIITEETKDRLNPQLLAGSDPLLGPANTNDPTFIEETDFETSVLIAFEWDYSGHEKLAIETVDLEDEETIHLYGCRYGDPWGDGGEVPALSGDRQYAATLSEPSAGNVITFSRLHHIPSTAKFTFTFREDHTGEKETETYVTEVEDLDSS